jgi:hypothetical protein
MTEPVRFVVEQAACVSCAERVQAALSDLIVIDELRIDEPADAAVVRGRAAARLEQAAVDAALARASHGSGHAYRVSPGSWRSGSE